MQSERRDQEAMTVAAPAKQSERRPVLRPGGLRAAGIAAARVAAPIVANRGGGSLARLKAEWNAVAGAEFATSTWPEALGRDGALKLRVVPARALELQHRAPLLMERINGFFGRTVAARLVLVQAMLPSAAAPAPGGGPTPLTDGEAQALDARLDDIADPELRSALAGLGRLVLGSDRSGC
jgi:hypothetical protein